MQAEEMNGILPNAGRAALAEARADLVAWDERMAQWVERLVSPAPLALVAILLAAQAAGEAGAWIWAAFYAITAIFLPAAYVLWKVRIGEISDYSMLERSQRIRPLTLILLSGLWAWLIFWGCGAPVSLTVFAGAGVVLAAFLLLINMVWRISGSGAAASSLAVFAYALHGSIALPVVLIVPLVLWARTRLDRSCYYQTAVGALLGALLMGAVCIWAVDRFGGL